MYRKLFLIVALSGAMSITANDVASLLQKYRMMALDYNHDLKAAEKNISASVELERAARADLKPKLQGGANFQYTGNPMELSLSLPGSVNPVTFHGNEVNYGASVSLLQPVYTGGRVLEAIRLAQHRNSLANYELEAIRNAVCYQTDIQYWNTVARAEMVGIATEFRNSVASLTETIRERVRVGLIDSQDLLMAEVKLNEAEYLLLQAKNNLVTGRMALNSILGTPLDVSTLLDETIPVVSCNDTLFSMSEPDRPEVKIASGQVQIAESSLRLNDSKYKPQLYIGAEGSFSSPGYNFNSDPDPNYGVYAKLTVPIFEWGKRRNERNSYAQRRGIALDNLHKVEDWVELEIATARVALKQALSQVELSENSLGKAKENERKALERYQEGKVSILEVIDAQTYRQTSQINYVQAKAAAQGHYSALLKSLNAYPNY